MARAPGDIESFSTGENVYARGGPADRVHRGSLWFEELVWELRVSPVALACRPGNLKLIDETERDLLLAVEMDHVVTTLKKQQDHAARVAEALNPPAARPAGRPPGRDTSRCVPWRSRWGCPPTICGRNWPRPWASDPWRRRSSPTTPCSAISRLSSGSAC